MSYHSKVMSNVKVLILHENDLDLTDDLELLTNRKVLSQLTHMSNMKALTHTNEKIWPILMNFFSLFLSLT